MKRLCRIVNVKKKLFGFMSESGRIDAVFILKRMEEEYILKEEGCICVLWI